MLVGPLVAAYMFPARRTRIVNFYASHASGTWAVGKSAQNLRLYSRNISGLGCGSSKAYSYPGVMGYSQFYRIWEMFYKTIRELVKYMGYRSIRSIMTSYRSI